MHRIYPGFKTGAGAVGLLLVRLATGAAFIFHGWGKIQDPLHWMGKDAPVPGPLQAAAAVAEFGGGIGMILGLLTPIAAIGIVCVMCGALGLYHLPQGHPFVNMDPKGGPSYELAVVYLANAIAVLLLGPGVLSADYLLWGGRRVGDKPPL